MKLPFLALHVVYLALAIYKIQPTTNYAVTVVFERIWKHILRDLNCSIWNQIRKTTSHYLRWLLISPSNCMSCSRYLYFVRKILTFHFNQQYSSLGSSMPSEVRGSIACTNLKRKLEQGGSDEEVEVVRTIFGGKSRSKSLKNWLESSKIELLKKLKLLGQ